MEEFNNSQSNDQEDENNESEQSKFKQWFQDNLRIMISILIVVLIAGGIYSYSKRTQTPTSDLAQNNQGAEDMIQEENQAGEEGATVKNSALSEQKQDSSQKENSAPSEKVAPIASSQETEGSFVQTAGVGDSKTTLARSALSNYLEKNPDSALTLEHKIYIEDYLRKNVGYSGRVFVGTSVEFSKDLVQNAITKSKDLTENQLQNLHKYVVRAPSLS